MNITKEQIGEFNIVVKIDITENDYKNKVDSILKGYIKKVNIPGFRKGQIPMGLIRRRYGKTILIEEVNKLVEESLNKYIVDENLDVIASPLEKECDDLNWDSDNFSFEIELGLAPIFDSPLKTKKALTRYNIIADDKIINEQVEQIQKQYGKLISKTEISKKDEVCGVFKNETEGIDHKTTIELSELKSKKSIGSLLGKKVGDTVVLKTKRLLKKNTELSYILGVDDEKAKKLDIEVSFTIEDINKREVAELNQELFDKFYGEGILKSEKDLKIKIKEYSEKRFEEQSDQKMYKDIKEHFIKNTKFNLPVEFLTKWIQINSEESLSKEEAKEEYNRLEMDFRFELIEHKIIRENNLKINFDEFKEIIKGLIKELVREKGIQYEGVDLKEEEDIDDFATTITLSDSDEIKMLFKQLMRRKLNEFYREKVKLKTKKISYKNFLKEVL